MNKILLLIITTAISYAQCTPSQEKEALKIWRSSIHQEENQKTKLLDKADTLCPDMSLIVLDKKILVAKNNPTYEKLRELTLLNNSLEVSNSEITHKWNNGRMIDQLWLKYFQQEKEQLSTQKGASPSALAGIEKNIDRLIKGHQKGDGLKDVVSIGGSYEADLLFDQDKSQIKDQVLTRQIIEVLHGEIEANANALFGLAGGASSEGTSAYNEKLSQQRAEALQNAIIEKYPNNTQNIKIFAQGESQLVCGGDLLPEKNSEGEYECITKENREKSRRVTIRRVR